MSKEMPLLSHYTTRAGLEGIAKTQTLWATNFLTMEDRSEMFYGWRALQQCASQIVIDGIPEELKNKDRVDLTEIVAHTTAAMKRISEEAGGYGSPFIVSFARHDTEDHENRGIKSMWDIYAKRNGYCLQFDRGRLESALVIERGKGSYHLIGLFDVHYGVDFNASDFKELCWQLAQQWLLQAYQRTADPRVKPDAKHMWADGYLVYKIMLYCGIHKDPFFADEREVRILAYPAPEAGPSQFFGIAARKKIMEMSGGKKYIEIGQFSRPGIIPRRIVLAPNSSRDLNDVIARYELPHPVILNPELPVA